MKILTAMIGAWLIILTTAAMAQTPTPAESLHAKWEALLQKHVRHGLVNYGDLKKDPKSLDTYLDHLSRTSPASLSKDGRLAYWINAYNAFTVKLILNHYPLKSIRDIKRPWKQKSWRAGGKLLSLDDIEHRILRKEFKEPRIHFAIVCASTGCPALWEHAFTEKNVRQELGDAARRFMGSKKHVTVSSTRKLFGKSKPVLHLSRIFTWFSDDFTAGGTRSVPDFVAEYASAEVREVIHSAGGKLTVKYLDYDWGLNEKR